MVTTRQRRQVVSHLLAAYSVSARRACRLVGLARSRWQYCWRRPPPSSCGNGWGALAAERPRWGYKRLHVLLRREGYRV